MPPSATGAAYGLRAQIFSQKLPLGIPFMYNQYLESHSPENNTPETPPLILAPPAPNICWIYFTNFNK